MPPYVDNLKDKEMDSTNEERRNRAVKNLGCGTHPLRCFEHGLLAQNKRLYAAASDQLIIKKDLTFQ